MILDISIDFAIILIIVIAVSFVALFKTVRFFIQKEYDLDKYIGELYTVKPYWYQMENGRFPYPPANWETTTYYKDDNYKKYSKLPYGAYGKDIAKRKGRNEKSN